MGTMTAKRASSTHRQETTTAGSQDLSLVPINSQSDGEHVGGDNRRSPISDQQDKKQSENREVPSKCCDSTGGDRGLGKGRG